ncbi:MAG: lipopolysaccharide transport periplasmic protein LptA [Gammaproteobacteria bacterium]|nr:lipopolysaccharide transport periplasmic protein LptA [Gammaproteobacteria bacterium]
MNWRNACCAGMLVILCQHTHGASADRSEVAEIRADRVTIDQQQQVSRYFGHVEFSQGSVWMTGDEVILATRDGELRLIDIRGTPATYREIDDAGQQMRARAEEIFYDTDAGLIRLQGNAHLCRGGEYFRSAYIEYNTQTRAVNAGKPGATESERVRITLRPGNTPSPTDCEDMP